MAVIVPLALAVIVASAWKKTNVGARLAAIFGVTFAVWALIAVASTSAAVAVAAGVASGISEFMHGVGSFILHLHVPGG